MAYTQHTNTVYMSFSYAHFVYNAVRVQLGYYADGMRNNLNISWTFQFLPRGGHLWLRGQHICINIERVLPSNHIAYMWNLVAFSGYSIGNIGLSVLCCAYADIFFWPFRFRIEMKNYKTYYGYIDMAFSWSFYTPPPSFVCQLSFFFCFCLVFSGPREKCRRCEKGKCSIDTYVYVEKMCSMEHMPEFYYFN